MSVVSISLVIDMRPSENEGSAVLSIRTMAGFASVASETPEAVDFNVPSKVTLRATGSACRCRKCSSIRQSTREVVLTFIQNSPEHKLVEFKVHVQYARNEMIGCRVSRHEGTINALTV